TRIPRGWVYRYGIFAHDPPADAAGILGRGERPGDDFAIYGGTGTRTHAAASPPCGDADACFFEQATLMMREFGHNLHLRHGGDTELNCKPNYMSIMNYAYPLGRGALEYSTGTHLSLNENSLNEAVGLGPNARADRVVWFGPSLPSCPVVAPFPSTECPLE